MKVEGKQPKFSPISITLETIEELEAFQELLTWGSRRRPPRSKELGFAINEKLAGLQNAQQSS